MFSKKSVAIALVAGSLVASTGAVLADPSVGPTLRRNIHFIFNGVEQKLPSDMAAITYQDHIYVPVRFATDQLGAQVSWEGSNKTVTVNSGVSTNVEGSLRSIPKTPKDYVQAYLSAMATRNGVLARMYLPSTLQDDIPNRTIGTSQWLAKWDITQTDPQNAPSSNGDSHFTVTAYQYVMGATPQDGSYLKAFDATITVSPQIQGSNSAPYIITAEQFHFRDGLTF